MSIQPEWKKKYDGLKGYIEANPEIYIDSHELTVPEHLRDGFYKHFDEIRHAFIGPNFFKEWTIKKITKTN